MPNGPWFVPPSPTTLPNDPAIRAVASASSRTRARTSGLPAIAAWVVIAPTRVTPSAAVT